MPIGHTKTGNDARDPDCVSVIFSAQAREAFRDLEAAVHFSPTFDPEMLTKLQDWSAGKKTSVSNLAVSLTLIGQETFKHVAASGDQTAAQAWSNIASALSERGFVLDMPRVTSR